MKNKNQTLNYDSENMGIIFDSNKLKLLDISFNKDLNIEQYSNNKEWKRVLQLLNGDIQFDYHFTKNIPYAKSYLDEHHVSHSKQVAFGFSVLEHSDQQWKMLWLCVETLERRILLIFLVCLMDTEVQTHQNLLPK